MSIKDLVPSWGRKNLPGRRDRSGMAMTGLEGLHTEVDRLFDRFFEGFGLPALAGFGGEGFAPRVDVREDEKSVVVTAELPGMDESDVSVELGDSVLTLKGERKQEQSSEEDGYHYSECRYGSFHRTIPLPSDIQPEGSKARFKRGVLTVTMPKSKQEHESRKAITVEAA